MDAESSSKTRTGASKQSCDQCRARRKKCNRASPCVLCVKSDLRCTYDKNLKKRGPEGKVVRQLKQQQSQQEQLSREVSRYFQDDLHVPPAPSHLVPFATLHRDLLCQEDLSNIPFFNLHVLNPDRSPLSLPSPIRQTPMIPRTLLPFSNISLAGLSVEDISKLVSKYFDHIHPCYPLVDRDWFLTRLYSGEPFEESEGVFATMLLSCCALTMAFMSNVLCCDDRESFKSQRDTVTSQVVLRHYMQPLGNSDTTLEQVITTFLMGLYFAIVFGDRAGHFRIAEAAHLAKSMGLHSRSTYLTMDTDVRRRSLAVFSCVVSSNRACELRQGMSEIIHTTGTASLLTDLDGILDVHMDSSHTIFRMDERSNAIQHLTRIVSLYDIVSPSFSKCARDQCDLDTCHLSPSGMIHYTKKLEHAASAMPVSMFQAVQPLLDPLEETRWIEFLVGHGWLAAHIWHIATRHSIDMSQLEGGKYRQLPLDILDAVAQVVSVANAMSLHVLGTGLVHRLSYICACGISYLQTNAIDMQTLERASADLTSISDAINGWDPKCWTRCIFQPI